ncbi:NAD(P)/FAD-dependent oxidoreductase [Pseudogemmobacter humi]|uniref:4-methylaminobutanoate oxidase (Formaldehyde-forming) n=1 Tax=Pseudogemmobacter humi TaxID=2483812 RepID=A0A3P5XQR1_9RHOB|nr:FAD-dependent oxidoreductase [Pseudogemmobacter humi]VDC30261.1 4-methylaminobutanoate oxidase (formaldehyde-forming) [Pseudogemmobacter humi]
MRFPITIDTPVGFAAELPARADVVVIGGGIIGVMTAYYLAERGAKVVLCEKGRIAGEQSSRNWGWIRQQGRDPAELPIVMESLRIWQDLARGLGDPLGYRETGVMYLANEEGDMAGFQAWLDMVAGSGVDSRLISGAEVAQMIPSARADWKGGLWTASDARAEPFVAVPLLARLAAEKGVTIRENCAVRCLDIAAGQVAGVVTEAGRIACDQVVVAAGAWSRLFLRAHGVRIPQLSVLASVAATEPLPEVFAGAAADSYFAFRRRVDGGYTLAPGDHHDFWIGPDAFREFFTYLPLIGRTFSNTGFRPMAPRGFPDAWSTPRWLDGDLESPFERLRILDPKPNRRAIGRLRDRFAGAFPGIGRPKIAAAWAGMIETMPDIVPVIDRAPLGGLIIATGLSGHGFGIGPGMGRVIADLTLGRDPGHDLTRFRLSRFSDGTKLVPGPSL